MARKDVNSELLVEALSIAFYALVAGILTIGGLFAEYTSVQYYGTGDLAVAVWLALFGAVMLYAGAYGVGYGKLLSRFV